MTPGRSLPPNTIGRSIAPAASTARLATIRQQPLARLDARGGTGHMIVDALDRAVGAAVVDAEHGGAAHDAHIGQAVELGLDVARPIRSPGAPSIS